jgi:hypothetical protein
MHGNGELGSIQSAALLGVRQEPDTTQDLIWKPGALKDLLRDFAY